MLLLVKNRDRYSEKSTMIFKKNSTSLNALQRIHAIRRLASIMELVLESLEFSISHVNVQKTCGQEIAVK